MNADEITLKDEHGAEVVSISVYRARRFRDRHLEQVCAHTSVIADPLEAKLTCRACKKQIDPIAWLAAFAENWQHVEWEAREARKTLAALAEATAVINKRNRCKCVRCGQMTPILKVVP